MATQILRPTSTDTNQWSVGNKNSVDEVVSEPNTPGDGNYWSAGEPGGDNNEIIEMGFGTIADITEVTRITVWTCGFRIGGDNAEVDVNMGGYQGAQECNVGTGLTWKENIFNGSWSQADLNGLQVKYIADVPDKGDLNGLEVVYVIVTFDLAPVGYGHDFMGVPAANIDNVSGVPAANIDNIKGV